MLRRGAQLTATIAGLLALGGCARTGVTAQTTPTCNVERNPNILVLEAQSVPAADRVPCVALVPAGWSVAAVDVRRGRSRFNLSNDRAGDRALEVRLEATCNIEGSSQVPSDEPGTRRFERIDSVQAGFSATRFYMFDGGCVTYRFRFEAANRALVNEASLALSFLTRQDLRTEVDRVSKGQIKL
jgi:hypothetical protein